MYEHLFHVDDCAWVLTSYLACNPVVFCNVDQLLEQRRPASGWHLLLE
jgi:hypothetical protein